MIVKEGVECEVSTPHPSLRPRPAPQTGLRRRVSSHLNVPTPDNDFRVHANSTNNLLRCLTNRVLTYKGEEIDQTRPNRTACNKLRHSFEQLVLHPVTKMTDTQFIEESPPHRRKIYEAAAKSLLNQPLDARPKSKDARVKTFIKAEKFDFKAKGASADPRAIQPRDPRFLLEMGRYIKPMEKPIYKALDGLYGEPVIAKGYNAEQTGRILHEKWARFKDPVAISLDASRFDLHVTQRHLRLCHEVYLRMNAEPFFQELLNCTLENKGLASSDTDYVEYEVPGRRMSGDMDTALGNCLLMTIITYTVFKELGIPHTVFDNGDDIVVICEREDSLRAQPDTIRDKYTDYGLRVVVEDIVSVFERITFCQTRPVWRGDQYVMTRLISSLAKDGTMLGNKLAFPAWLDGVGMCGLSLTDGLPIYPAFYRMLQRKGKRSRRVERSLLAQCGMFNLVKGMHNLKREIVTDSRISFYKAFGITPGMQMAIERYYDSLQDPAGNIYQPWLKEDLTTFQGEEWFKDDPDLNVQGL